MLFTQTATGLIKALRANKNAEHHVITQALSEINDEIPNSDFDIKAAAVLKLTYLEMLGYPTLLKHAFNVIECMSSPRFHIKQIGYLAASQSFASSTEVILLVHNLVKKDLTASAHPSTVILALTSLPTLLAASPQLAEDLLPDLLRMLSHSRPPVRRIAFLVIGKVWASQGSVPLEFAHVEKIRGGLNDQDASVVSTTVNVMLELGRSRPDSLPSLLGLAPELFDLLTSSTNNWMLIKIVKLFAILTPIEPRLVRKLLPPLSNLIATTPAFSLLYECIQTVITGGMLSSSASSEQASLATTCIDKLSSFLSDSDQNLRYIALKGLSRLLVTGHAHLLSPHYDEILTCIDEEDLTIRLKALELIERLADRSTCKDVVARLIAQISPGTAKEDASSNKHGRNLSQPSAVAALRAISASYDPASPSGMANEDIGTLTTSESTRAVVAEYRYKLLHLILRLITRSSDDGSQLYVNISNFEWFIDTLVTTTYLSLPLAAQVPTSLAKVSIGEQVANALLDVTARAAGIRAFAVKRMRRILNDDSFVDRAATTGTSSTTNAVLGAAAFIVSEYASGVDDRAEAEQLYAKARYNPVCAFCAVKITARWLHAISGEAWSENMMPSVKEHLQESIAMLQKSAESPYLPQLLRIVLSNLDGEREEHSAGVTQNESTIQQPEESADSADPSHNPFASTAALDSKSETPAQQGVPKCLTLLHSLLFSYELRPLAAEAQAAVPVPDGLDLNAWVGQPLDNPAYLTWNDEDSDSQSVKGDVDEYGRPRVAATSASSRDASRSGDGKKSKKSKSRSKTSTERDDGDDVDSIPIVKLDLEGSSLLSPPVASTSLSTSFDQAEPASRRKSVKQPARPRTPSPPPLILTAGGDMPTISRPASRPVSTNNIAKADDTSLKKKESAVAADESLTIDQQAPVKVKKKSKKAEQDAEQVEVTKAKKSKKKKQIADLGDSLVDVG